VGLVRAGLKAVDRIRAAADKRSAGIAVGSLHLAAFRLACACLPSRLITDDHPPVHRCVPITHDSWNLCGSIDRVCHV